MIAILCFSVLIGFSLLIGLLINTINKIDWFPNHD